MNRREQGGTFATDEIRIPANKAGSIIALGATDTYIPTRATRTKILTDWVRDCRNRKPG